MNLAKYLSAESVKRRSEKPPRESERDEHVERPENHSNQQIHGKVRIGIEPLPSYCLGSHTTYGKLLEESRV